MSQPCTERGGVGCSSICYLVLNPWLSDVIMSGEWEGDTQRWDDILLCLRTLPATEAMLVLLSFAVASNARGWRATVVCISPC